MLDLVLYGTSHCHLCEEAETLLQPYINAGVCQVEVLDVMADPDWLSRYGERIPVLKRRSSDACLEWPFPAEQLDAWLRTEWRRSSQHERSSLHG